jgi:hypothetical protein
MQGLGRRAGSNSSPRQRNKEDPLHDDRGPHFFIFLTLGGLIVPMFAFNIFMDLAGYENTYKP